LTNDVLKRGVFVAALFPLILLLVDAVTANLTANPIEHITHQTGTYALVLLMTTLGVTPLRRLTGWNSIIRVRRMLGLFTFFYATLHLLTWAVLDQFFAFGFMVEDIIERPFITTGMATYLLLLPLAITSNTKMIQRLGRRWKLLHRLIYLAAGIAVLHFWWGVKADIREPRLWAIALSVLLGVRIFWFLQNRLSSRS
jgi:sulfoxide reductase heme-binding subunit YedZ